MQVLNLKLRDGLNIFVDNDNKVVNYLKTAVEEESIRLRQVDANTLNDVITGVTSSPGLYREVIYIDVRGKLTYMDNSKVVHEVKRILPSQRGKVIVLVLSDMHSLVGCNASDVRYVKEGIKSTIPQIRETDDDSSFALRTITDVQRLLRYLSIQ